MMTRLIAVAALAALLGAAAVALAPRLAAQGIFSGPGPDKARYRLVTEELIAAPDVRSFVNGWTATVIRDVQTNQCYTVFVTGRGSSVVGPTICPQ